MTGKTIRLRRLGREGLYVLIPLDHGVSVGPIQGLENVTQLLKEIDAGGATGVILHKGLVKNYAAASIGAGLLLHVSSSTDKAPDPNDKRLVATAADAVRLGCDGVSAHTNLGSKTEERQLEEFGRLTTEAAALGLPALSMMYPRGPTIKDPYEERTVAHAARLAEELGADLVKTVYTGDPKTFRNVSASVTIPVLVAGGPKVESDRDVLELVHGAMRGGAAGVSIGRNVFQHRSPRRMTAAIARIVLEGASAADALKTLKEVKA
jgi:fructose-bisphosphate aldolase / 2-amino-3,7-dideoxy-D-threo-hept-6-ulosonate synthase